MNAPIPTVETLTFECDCGAIHRATVGHYQLVKTKCGKYLRALQPKRGGPLGLFPWPGLNLTKQELAEKEAHDALRQAEGHAL